MSADSAEAAAHRLTVVVMTRDRWPDLQRSLPRHEAPVVLVDNGSTDGTPGLVRKHYPHVDVVELGRNHGAVARNVGVRRAATPYVAFADDDSWWAPGALQAAADLLDHHPRLAVLVGRMLVGPQERPDPICDLMASSPLGREQDLPGPSVLGFMACGAVLRREAYLAAGGFDDVIFFMGEEERLALDLADLGWGLAYVDHVLVHHHPSAHRDSVNRQALAARNRLLTAILRRPWPVVLQTVAMDLKAGRAGRIVVLQAIVALPRALPRRRRLQPALETSLRTLDQRGTARGNTFRRKSL